MQVIKTLFFFLILAAIAAGAGAWYLRYNAVPAVSFRTVEVKRGDLVASISATGTIEPEEVIDVGAQVAGLITGFGQDKNGKTIDYGSQVQEGMVLARIDDLMYAADAASASAQLEQAKANVTRSQADLGQLKAKLEQARSDWQRAQKLGPSDAMAESAYDGYKAAYETAQANVAVGEATIAQTQGAVLQAEAALKRAQRNLEYCVIKSPVDGVIIDRRVNIGQTVVSSLNAPSLFLIAKDLKRMQVWVAVNEADIGSIHPGQPVTFRVDAFPGEAFVGEVGKVRLNATMTQNVVTYTVEVVTDNSSGKLLPYLTANVQFEVSKHDNVLMVPNVALRWSPTSQDQIAPDARDASADPGRGGPGEAQPAAQPGQPATRPSGARRGNRGGRPEGSVPAAGPAAVEHKFGTLWVQDGAFVRPVRVRLGMSDGTNTEILSDQLKEGTPIVTGVLRADQSASSEARNPFMPQFPKGGGKKGV
jgi:HlyD family secretion protein